MAGRKCGECGLVNWADVESCKRCLEPLAGVGRPAGGGRETGTLDGPLLKSFNGIGTRLLGWKHREDGTATATVWFTFLFLPLLPLSRYALLSPGAEDFEPAVSLGQAAQGLGQSMTLTTDYRFIERLPLSGEEVFGTYLHAYVWLPLKIFAPLAVLIAVMKLFYDRDSSNTAAVIFMLLLCAWLGYALFVLATQLRRSRGGV
ncbi:MAG TPA: hypothetical protein VN282_15415 [Pyrinomonadaceae bacterium]|nr:hypothetical protein [Pyrinomonadaceae bacterium]